MQEYKVTIAVNGASTFAIHVWANTSTKAELFARLILLEDSGTLRGSGHPAMSGNVSLIAQLVQEG